MSIIGQTVSMPVVTIAAAMRKTFALAKFDGMVSGLVPMAENERVAPSAIKMNKAAAAAAMGGKATPQSFITGLLFNTCAFAYGQGNLESLTKGLPPVAIFAIGKACGLVAMGKGITAGGLRAAVLSAMADVMSLPLSAKKAAAPKVETKGETIDGESVRVEEQAAAPDYTAAAMLAGGPLDNTAAEKAGVIGLRLVADEKKAAEKAAAEQAKKAAEQAEQAAAPDFIGLFSTLAAAHHDQAAAMLPAMAAACGLVVITAEQAAMLAAAEQAAAMLAAAPKKSRAKKAA